MRDAGEEAIRVDALVEVIRNLIFSAIAITMVEMLVPEGQFKKYFNYIGGCIFLSIMASAIWDLHRHQEEILKSFSSPVPNTMHSLEALEEKKKGTFEKMVSLSIQNEIEQYFQKEAGIEKVDTKLDMIFSEDLKEVQIRSLTLFLPSEVPVKEAFFRWIKEKFNVKQEAIRIELMRR